MGNRTASVLTISDGVARGTRDDRSGPAVADVLAGAGFDVVRTQTVPDERAEIARAITLLASTSRIVVSTGGTGLGARDVTPEATRDVIHREVPGLAEAMRAVGRASTPAADLSRGLVGAIGSTLVVNLPGSERGATESLEAILGAIPHALDLLGGDPGHAHGPMDERGDGLVVATAVRVNGDPPCRPGQKLLVRAGAPVEGTLGCAEFDDAAIGDSATVAATHEPLLATYRHDLGSVEVYLEPRTTHAMLVVLGATPVALALLRWGRDLGYETVLVEPREDRLDPDYRAAAGRVVADVADVPIGSETDAVHTDHDAPKVAEHMATLVRSGARFVGVMGSRRHAAPHLDALRDLGLSDDEVARVRTPVGLDLGARTPEEIALSILAGLVAARNGRSGTWLDRMEQP